MSTIKKSMHELIRKGKVGYDDNGYYIKEVPK
jgi:hypothetical protein